ncbi:MAG: hypothetical protein ACE5HO_09940 [bacterium]
MAGRNDNEKGSSVFMQPTGFTVVELAIALITSAIVLIGIAIIVAGSYKYLRDGTARVQLQQDYSFIEMLLSTNLQQSTYDSTEVYNSFADFLTGQPPQSSGSCIKTAVPSQGWNVFYRDSLDFKLLTSDSSAATLVAGVVANLSFVKQTNSVRTDLTLNRTGWSVGGSLVAAFRN